MTTTPKVAIIGRINVGKSTLFNRLSGGSRALVSIIPGTTRDKNISYINWRFNNFILIDTGGIDLSRDAKKIIEKKTLKYSLESIKEAQLLVFVVDARTGITEEDKKIADLLRQKNKPIILAVNKIDHGYHEEIHRFYALRLGEPMGVSSLNGVGTGNLLDRIAKKLTFKKNGIPEASQGIKVALVGRPNVGKSSLINAIFNADRVMVSPEPFTTREPRDLPFFYEGRKISFIDTVGIRKKAKAASVMEITGVMLTKKQIERADVCLLVLEANASVSHQDLKLASEANNGRSGLIILVNKWDVIEDKGVKTQQELKSAIQNCFRFISWAPIVFTSAYQPQKVLKIMPEIVKANDNRSRRINDKKLDSLMKRMVKKHLPTKGRGTRYPRVFDLKQVDISPPTFQVSIGAKSSLADSYLKFIEKQLRGSDDFTGSPIKIYVKKSKVV